VQFRKYISLPYFKSDKHKKSDFRVITMINQHYLTLLY